MRSETFKSIQGLYLIAYYFFTDTWKTQMMMFLNYMQGSRYKDQLRREIDNEREKNKQLKARAAQLDKQIGSLQKDSIGQLKGRLGEVRLKCSLCRVNCVGE